MAGNKEQEIKDIRANLKIIDTTLRGELEKIEKLKAKIKTGYRHHDKEGYEKERSVVQGSLEKLTTEQETTRKKLSELEGTGKGV
jgi:septation ring formation regulator EzrA